MLSEAPLSTNHRLAMRLLLMALFLTLALSGCGGGTPAPESVLPTPLRSPLSPTVTPTPTPPSELEPMVVTLELWLPEELNPYADEPGARALLQQLDQFSETYPDVQVDVVVKKAHGRGGLLDFMQAAKEAAPSVLPDVVVLDAADLEETAKQNLIQPLDDLLSSGRLSDRFSFAVEMAEAGDEDATMGFVIGADMQHLAYRTGVLESPPVSWTQIISPPISFIFPAGGRDRQVNDATLIQYLSAGGRLTDPDGNPTLDEDALVSVLDFYSDCISTAAISPTYATPAISPTVVLNLKDADQAWERFKNGEGDIAIVRAGRYWLEADETMGAAPIPTRDGRPLSIARGWVVAMVTDNPARQALATLLLNWLVAPEHNGPWTQAAGYLPASRGALRMWDISNADRATLQSVMGAAIPAPPPKVMTTVGKPMQDAVEAVLRGRATPEEAAAAAIKALGR